MYKITIVFADINTKKWTCVYTNHYQKINARCFLDKFTGSQA